MLLCPTSARGLFMPKYTSGELITFLNDQKYLFLIYACFLKINNA
jgi:hypothetical protein